MMRILLTLLLIVAGFLAGLTVSGRTRAAAEPGVEPSAAATTTDASRESDATAGTAPARPAGDATTASAAESQRAAPAQTAAGPDFTRVAGAAVKGVANISSVQYVQRRSSPFDSDPFFRYFFGDDPNFGGRSRRAMSLGSGVVITADGYVVTNSHVIGEDVGVRQVTVALADKREVRGEIVGNDPSTDIALLKIDVTGLPVIPWGDSSRLQVGEWVLAIGSPFQLSQTVTAGIISATGRANLGFTDYEDFIQTDAAINPGNSGGALVNSRGELVGINTGIFSQSGGYQGIGFAVPSNLAHHVVEDLMKYGEVRRGTIMGIQVEPVSPQYARELDAPNTNGGLVSRMLRNSDAYAAGLRPGDIIIGFNGQPATDPAHLDRLLADAKIGSTGTLRVWRDGRTLDVRVPIVSRSGRRR
jgi:Do/DeqQ family serine protease